ncbi:hypothetical protein NYE48_12715 [Paenibacillus sp. FSL M7-1455]|uniref:Lipoprotein n=1 Tax=Paenibacillus cookii TaxID=157839 RepID=A0ABQ4LZ39_9BACL|nr:hypothetical protein [Paenibacillus cookii]GIO68540.1 hypothetical protein J21TS3_33610 [Paenibacillus cookii]
MIKMPITLFILLSLLGCSIQANNGGKTTVRELTGGQPPKASIQIGEQLHETKLGTYCWSSKNTSTCIDAVGPAELLKNKKPVKVRPGAEIKFVMDYEPLPNKIHLEQISEGKNTEIAVKENTFRAPTQKGTYYFSYGVWWMDEKREHVSLGDAFYVFALEVI